MVAANSRSRCKEQDIPFFRFSPKFDELIAAGETDNEKLINMIIKTKLALKEQSKEFDELVNIFRAVAESSKDLDQDVVLETKLQANGIIDEEGEEEEEEGGEGAQESDSGRIDKIDGLKKALEKEREWPNTHKEAPSALTEQKELPETPKPARESPEVEKKAEQEKTEGGDPIIQIRKVNDKEVCLLEPGEFTGNFLFNSISSALGEKLELPKDDSLPPATPTSAGVAHIFATPIKTDLHAQVSRHSSHGPIVSSSGIVNKNQGLESRSSTGELYTPYRTDTKEVDKSKDEYTEYKRETLV